MKKLQIASLITKNIVPIFLAYLIIVITSAFVCAYVFRNDNSPNSLIVLIWGIAWSGILGGLLGNLWQRRIAKRLPKSESPGSS